MTSGLFGTPLMVVMEFISGSPSNERFGETSVPQPVYDRVKAAIDALHEKDIVFGDLRCPNIMVTDSNEVKMIDFDWCGKDGEATYPATLNDADGIPWHPSISRGSVMRKEHDIFMLKGLRPAVLLTGIAEEREPDP
jgi:serine/threonine protein kinase